MVFKWFLNGFLNGLFVWIIVTSRTSTACSNRVRILVGTKKAKTRALRTIPRTPEILEKTSQSADHPRDRRKSWKKTSQYYGFACCCCWLVGSDKLCRGPLRGQTNNLGFLIG